MEPKNPITREKHSQKITTPLALEEMALLYFHPWQHTRNSKENQSLGNSYGRGGTGGFPQATANVWGGEVLRKILHRALFPPGDVNINLIIVPEEIAAR